METSWLGSRGVAARALGPPLYLLPVDSIGPGGWPWYLLSCVPSVVVRRAEMHKSRHEWHPGQGSLCSCQQLEALPLPAWVALVESERLDCAACRTRDRRPHGRLANRVPRTSAIVSHACRWLRAQIVITAPLCSVGSGNGGLLVASGSGAARCPHVAKDKDGAGRASSSGRCQSLPYRASASPAPRVWILRTDLRFDSVPARRARARTGPGLPSWNDERCILAPIPPVKVSLPCTIPIRTTAIWNVGQAGERFMCAWTREYPVFPLVSKANQGAHLAMRVDCAPGS
ncbi:hypothetical protein CGRA01v4_07623 [Colletotrichum graminicola]|nr:hypothetical protein CGRA01v4_07623 [Colletotrichum graminicola]